MARRSLALALLALAASGCCFGGGPFASLFSGPTTSLDPGFTPDPTMLSGTAGGPLQASSFDPSCSGWLPRVPNHTLRLSGPIPNLRLLVHSDIDTTLVVRLSDGRYLCNDDSDGFDPVVEGAFPAGEHRVYVGTRFYVGTARQGNSWTYELGITTNPGLTPSTMAGGAGSGAGAGVEAPPGTVRRSGTATVMLATGDLPGVHPGTTCTYTQTAADSVLTSFDCRWRVECSGIVVYGEGTGGYTRCQDPSWPSGVLVVDPGTTSADGDPALIVNAGGLLCNDDAEGPRGAFAIIATLASDARPPR
jgi:hypothetical protein